MTRRLGLVVNPVAGLGGPAGLKGSDGIDAQATAVARGSVPRAETRAVAALEVVARGVPDASVLTVGGAMGEASTRAAGLVPVVVAPGATGPSSAADTTRAVELLRAAGAGLVLFVGGDGTARDVVDAEGCGLVLGVPAGVKMYSACFAVSPAAAGTVAASWLAGASLATEEREVLDVTEDQVRQGRVDPRLHGLLEVPAVRWRTQSRKTPSPGGGGSTAAAAGAVGLLEPGVRYLLGPGSTLTEVARRLGVPKTPLGVDVVEDGQLVVADAGERDLLDAIAGHRARAVVTVIGGQGFLLGRGNQQLSAEVLTRLGPDPLLVVADQDKLAALSGAPLLVDTGDPAVDAALSGHVRIVTGPGLSSVYPVRSTTEIPNREGVASCD